MQTNMLNGNGVSDRESNENNTLGIVTRSFEVIGKVFKLFLYSINAYDKAIQIRDTQDTQFFISAINIPYHNC